MCAIPQSSLELPVLGVILLRDNSGKSESESKNLFVIRMMFVFVVINVGTWFV